MIGRFASKLLASISLSVIALTAAAQGDAYPNKPIRMIVPYAAGGPTDVLARIVGLKLGEIVGQAVIVDNRPGASGIPGTDAVARAAPDGYTIGLSTIGPLAVNPSLIPNVPYDTLRDFAPLVLLARSYSVLTVHPSVPANNFTELLALLKANPGKYTYATGGIGTTQHLSGELLQSVAGVKMLHVPYKGEGSAQTDLLGGQVSMMFQSSLIALQHVRAGKLRAVAVTSPHRLPSFPDTPTIAESGFPGFEVTAWYGMVAPAGTPAPIVRKLNDALQAVLRQPEVVAKLADLGAVPAGGPPGDLTALLKVELPKWRDVIKRGNIKAE
ncbi:MAG: tripartite tricarboxylate transporter substrate binding protein [Ramlibacter sp.]|nr:tripartite tricarboxylate transporter substrate binding protein [Ramlibacter sp.]